MGGRRSMGRGDVAGFGFARGVIWDGRGDGLAGAGGGGWGGVAG